MGWGTLEEQTCNGCDEIYREISDGVHIKGKGVKNNCSRHSSNLKYNGLGFSSPKVFFFLM